MREKREGKKPKGGKKTTEQRKIKWLNGKNRDHKNCHIIADK